MEKSNNIKDIAESRLAYETSEFKKDFESGDMARIPERYFRACRGLFMFSVWEHYINDRKQNIVSGNKCNIQEFMSLLESRGHSVTLNKENGWWNILIGKTQFDLKESRKNHCIIYAKTPEFKWAGGMYDDNFLEIRLSDAESLIEGMEQLDAVNDEFITRLDNEIEYWKKMLRINSKTL